MNQLHKEYKSIEEICKDLEVECTYLRGELEMKRIMNDKMYEKSVYWENLFVQLALSLGKEINLPNKEEPND